jgi:hypothetical protein
MVFRMMLARAARVAAAGALLAGAIAGFSLTAQTAAPGTLPIAPKATEPVAAYTGPKYDNRWEVFGGLLYMNGQAGQDLPDRYNTGGGEAQVTYWLGSAPIKRFGVAADYRIGAGTSQVAPVGAAYGLNRLLVYQNIFSGGGVYRSPFRNRYAAVDFHAFAGGAYGVFDHALNNYPGYPGPGSPNIVTCPAEITAQRPNSLGLYCNHMTGWGAAGGSIDFNDSAKLAFRLSPDITFEHYGTETREFFSISLGVMYRLGKVKK